jgi:DNA-binding MarR family transcriptional regulator
MEHTQEPGAEHPAHTEHEHGEEREHREHREAKRSRDRHHRHGRHHGRPEPLTDEPVGTTPEALAEAFFGIGRLLRGRGTYRSARPRGDGLTFARGALLAALDSDGPQRMGRLAHRLGVVPRTITPMVDALEDGGLVVREVDPDDRRATMLHITEGGRSELTRSRSDRRSSIDEVFTVLSDSERTTLAGVLDKLRSAARQGLERDRDEGPDEGSSGPSGPDADSESGPRGRRGRGGRGRGERGPRRRYSWPAPMSYRRDLE